MKKSNVIKGDFSMRAKVKRRLKKAKHPLFPTKYWIAPLIFTTILFILAIVASLS